jgi:NAD(P)-dependent dehydrogenase (short-subunit alcohol dehydrogenase family)
MSGRLSGKRAVVTGAASGIGAACVRRFHAEGARVAGLDLAQPSGELPLAAFESADVRDEAQVARAIAALDEALGGIDCLINAAGVAGGTLAHELDLAEWQRVIDVNLTGTFLVAKHALAAMLRRKRPGAIVNLASVYGLEGGESTAPYNASKGGVVLLTRNLALDYGPQRIRSNCICPGFIRTPMTAALNDPTLKEVADRVVHAHPLGRLGEPEEIAAAALFLCSDDASFVNGAALTVDGGYTAGKRHGISADVMPPR